MRLAIQQKLGAIGDLRVIPWTTMEQYDYSGKTIQAIGKELQVDHVLEGFLEKDSENIILYIHVNNVIRKKEQPFSKNYVQNMVDVLNVQSQVISDIAAGYQPSVDPT